MQRLLDDKCRNLVSVFKGHYANTGQLEDHLAQYKKLLVDLDKEDIHFSNAQSHVANFDAVENCLIPIPVATYSTDVFPVTVRFLNGKVVQLLCPNFYKLIDIRPLLAKYVTSFDSKDMLLGFSQEIEGEVTFLDEKLPLEKLCGKSKSIDTTLLVKFYMPDALLLDNTLSRHQLYLQLRRDLSGSDRLWLSAQDRIQAAAYAFLAENVDNCFSIESNKISSLVGWRVVEQYGNAKVDSMLKVEVGKIDSDISKTDAELEFCKIVQNSENYGKRYYRIYAHKDFEVQLSSLYISLSIFGVTIEESSPTISADLPPTVVLHSFSWRQIARFSFAWHRLSIGIKQPQGNSHYDTKHKSANWVLHYYIRKKAIGNYLLQLAADLNQFQMTLLQTYRIDRIIFPRSSGCAFDAYKSATLPRSGDAECFEQLSSTMPRKYPSGIIDSGRTSGQASPILAFASSCGRASAPPPATNNLLISSKTNVSKEAPPPPPIQNQNQISGIDGIFFANKWRMSLHDFRSKLNTKAEDVKSDKTFAVKEGQRKYMTKSGDMLNNDNHVMQACRSEAKQQDTDDIIYACASSLVPVDKVVQGLPPSPRKAELYQVVLQRDANGSIGFSLCLDPATRHLIVRRISPGGVAEKSGAIKLGDRLVQIGDYNLAGKDYDDCVSLLRSISIPVKLTFERPSSTIANDSPVVASPLDLNDDEEGGESFDKLSYSHRAGDIFMPEEAFPYIDDPDIYQRHSSLASSSNKPMQNPVERRLESTLERMFSFSKESGAITVDGEDLGDLSDRRSNVISEDVVHEEMTYPSGSEFYDDATAPPAVEENPYAQTGEDIDENLIEKMLDALCENDDDEDGSDSSNESTPTFQIDVSKLDGVEGFGFEVKFSETANSRKCFIASVDRAQADASGLAINDVVVAVNGTPIQQIQQDDFSNLMNTENKLQLTLLAYIDKFTSQQISNNSEAVCYDFHLPSSAVTSMPPQLPTVSEIIKVSVTKQSGEELGCSMFACGSEIFIGTIKPSSKLAACGVQSGDMCLLVNNESVFGMPSEKVASALRSAAGQVILTLSRRKSPNASQRDIIAAAKTDMTDDVSKLVLSLGKRLSPATRAEFRRLAAAWRCLEIDDHDSEFTRISSEPYANGSAMKHCPSKKLGAASLSLNSCSYITCRLPSKQQTAGEFWQMIVDNDIQVVVVLGEVSFQSSGDRGEAFFPLQCDEVLRVNLTSSAVSSSVNVRLLTNQLSSDGTGDVSSSKLTVSKFMLTLSKEEKPGRVLHYIHCTVPLNSPGQDVGLLIDALILPDVLRRSSTSSPVLICYSDLSPSSFDQRGVFACVSSILSTLFTAASRSSIITASSVGESAATLRRQNPELLCCVEQLACMYACMVSAIDRLVAEDALSY